MYLFVPTRIAGPSLMCPVRCDLYFLDKPKSIKYSRLSIVNWVNGKLWLLVCRLSKITINLWILLTLDWNHGRAWNFQVLNHDVYTASFGADHVQGRTFAFPNWLYCWSEVYSTLVRLCLSAHFCSCSPIHVFNDLYLNKEKYEPLAHNCTRPSNHDQVDA